MLLWNPLSLKFYGCYFYKKKKIVLLSRIQQGSQNMMHIWAKETCLNETEWPLSINGNYSIPMMHIIFQKTQSKQ